ncbi:MAG: hypothetical protein OXC80_07685, partial [Gammaproteobacteria bacterium]|nr:hypothetical protein [Gammaproteobacteria bacterium]
MIARLFSFTYCSAKVSRAMMKVTTGYSEAYIPGPTKTIGLGDMESARRHASYGRRFVCVTRIATSLRERLSQ